MQTSRRGQRCPAARVLLALVIGASLVIGSGAPASSQALPEVSVFHGDAPIGPCRDDGTIAYLDPSFLFVRDDASTDLTVALVWGGTAEEGTDHGPLPTTVTFPAGDVWTGVPFPVLDGTREGRTVTVTVIAQDGYTVGTASATSTLRVDPCPEATTPTSPGVGSVGDAPSSRTEVLARTGPATHEAWLAGLGALLVTVGTACWVVGRRPEVER